MNKYKEVGICIVKYPIMVLAAVVFFCPYWLIPIGILLLILALR